MRVYDVLARGRNRAGEVWDAKWRVRAQTKQLAGSLVTRLHAIEIGCGVRKVVFVVTDSHPADFDWAERVSLLSLAQVPKEGGESGETS